jgi:hypothetical protein
VNKTSNELKIYAKGEEAIDSVIDAVRSNEGKIDSIKNVEPTLEDAFLKITGRRAEDKTTREGSSPRRRRFRGGF